MPAPSRQRRDSAMDKKPSITFKSVIYFTFVMSSILLIVLAVCLSGGASVSWRTLLAPLSTLNLFTDVSARQDGKIPNLVARLRAEKGRHDPSQAKLIFGYSACLDVAVKAKDFIPLVLDKFGIQDAQPKFHSKITCLF